MRVSHDVILSRRRRISSFLRLPNEILRLRLKTTLWHSRARRCRNWNRQ